MKKHLLQKVTLLVLMSLLLSGLLCGGCTISNIDNSNQTAPPAIDITITEDGQYTSQKDVAAYLHMYNHLPSNFITKKDAKALGWNSKDGNLAEVAPRMSIGGDSYGNYEKLLPDADGRKYYECDINYDGGYRNSERIVYSNDGLIFYTNDHYKSFEPLYS